SGFLSRSYGAERSCVAASIVTDIIISSTISRFMAADDSARISLVTYREIAPAAALRPWVECFWTRTTDRQDCLSFTSEGQTILSVRSSRPEALHPRPQRGRGRDFPIRHERNSSAIICRHEATDRAADDDIRDDARRHARTFRAVRPRQEAGAEGKGQRAAERSDRDEQRLGARDRLHHARRHGRAQERRRRAAGELLLRLLLQGRRRSGEAA